MAAAIPPLESLRNIARAMIPGMPAALLDALEASGAVNSLNLMGIHGGAFKAETIGDAECRAYLQSTAGTAAPAPVDDVTIAKLRELAYVAQAAVCALKTLPHAAPTAATKDGERVKAERFVTKRHSEVWGQYTVKPDAKEIVPDTLV